jgi:hypothetical protein
VDVLALGTIAVVAGALRIAAAALAADAHERRCTVYWVVSGVAAVLS